MYFPHKFNEQFLYHSYNNHKIVEIDLPEEWNLLSNAESDHKQQILYLSSFWKVYVLDIKIGDDELSHIGQYNADDGYNRSVEPK